MKPKHILRRLADRLPPQTWREVFAYIIILLLIFLAVAFGLDYLKGTLP